MAVVIAPPVICSGAAYLWREGAGPLGRQACCTERLLVQEFRDAEVEQLHAAVGRDEHIRRFEIAMDDQLGVGVSDGVQHTEEQADSRGHAERARVAVLVDRHALDMLEDQKWLPVRADPRVDQIRNVRMFQPPEDGAFPLEPFAARADERAQELDRDAPLKTAVGPLGEPHPPHPAFADLPHQTVGADRLAGHG